MTREELKRHCLKQIEGCEMWARHNGGEELRDNGVFVSRWIPVSERLPEENGYYLTTTMYHEVYCDFWVEDRFNRTEAVIAWMPLPKPYKAESEKVNAESSSEC